MKNPSKITKNFILFRSYSRLDIETNKKESWLDICQRNNECLSEISNLEEDQLQQIFDYQKEFISIPAGRFLWIGGTNWFKAQKNYYGAYNCTGIALESSSDIKRIANLGMMGCGTGVSLESKFIKKLPPVSQSIEISILNNVGEYYNKGYHYEDTVFKNERGDTINLNNKPLSSNEDEKEIVMIVGDSKEGWSNSIQIFLDCFFGVYGKIQKIKIDLGFVRPKGIPLAGFGGVSNPNKLTWMFDQLQKIMNSNVNQKLSSESLCLILDSVALMTVSGNIRRVAGIRQFDSTEEFLKLGLWNKDDQGNWSIIPEKQQMTVANHTHVFHKKPTYEEIHHSITSQYYSGEGALQYAPEAIARANSDIFSTKEEKDIFIEKYIEAPERGELYLKHLCLKNLKYIPPEEELNHRVNRYLLNPCAEIFSKDFLCNLSEIHLNLIDPLDYEKQEMAFKVGAWSTVALLHQEFDDQKLQDSRDLDPIIGVSFTGLFDFFVNLFGLGWLKWWEEGRPKYGDFSEYGIGKLNSKTKFKELKDIVEKWAFDPLALDSDLFKEVEAYFLNYWRSIVEKEVKEYCDKNNLKCPNRCTTVQPAGSKSLLTGASSGWSSPIGLRYIRRMSFSKNDPIAEVALEQGFSVIPNSTDIDEFGNIRKDIYDPEVSSWLIEVPVEVEWANLEGVEEIDFRFPAISQLDFWLNIQNNYSTHNTSATIVFEENEIEQITDWLFNNITNNLGYSSVAFLGRCENFPLMPFERISKEEYQKLIDPLIKNDAFSEDVFLTKLNQKTLQSQESDGPNQCDSISCIT